MSEQFPAYYENIPEETEALPANDALPPSPPPKASAIKLHLTLSNLQSMLDAVESYGDISYSIQSVFSAHAINREADPMMAGFAGEDAFFHEVNNYFARHLISNPLLVKAGEEILSEVEGLLKIQLQEYMFRWEGKETRRILTEKFGQCGSGFFPNKVEALLKESELAKGIWGVWLERLRDGVRLLECRETGGERNEA